jgi:hypothetical protein
MMEEKVSDEVLRELLRDCPMVGKLFKHYKTDGTYEVIARTIEEATQRPLVIYQNIVSGLTFARPLREWKEKCFVPERREWVERFQEVT